MKSMSSSTTNPGHTKDASPLPRPQHAVVDGGAGVSPGHTAGGGAGGESGAHCRGRCWG